ncbi:Complex 1 LYR protein [Sesbania bispinosa]|nr:Complex 1 LYR protein [Sesbania bispinosa]
MRSEAFHTAKIYRHLLKAVKKHIGKEETKRHFIEFVTSEFHKNRNLSDAVAIQQKIKLAHDYTFLLNSVHHHRSDEVRRTLGKSAASVGLQLPEVYQS